MLQDEQYCKEITDESLHDLTHKSKLALQAPKVALWYHNAVKAGGRKMLLFKVQGKTTGYTLSY